MLRFGLVVCLLAMAQAGRLNAEAIDVVVTIKPLALIAADIGGEQTKVRQLIPSNNSPHDYALRMSDRLAVTDARLVLWIGPSFEPFVGKLLSRNQPTLIVEQLQGVSWPAAHSSYHDGEQDPHLWLNPENAITIARYLADKLAELDPANRDAYMSNFKRFGSDLRELAQTTQDRLERLQKVPFVALHDAYGHFVSRYQLNQLGSLRSVSGAQAGARTLTALLAKAQEMQLGCVLTDPQFDTAPAQQFAKRTGVRVIELDPLGADIEPGPSGYKRFFQRFADRFEMCLSATHDLPNPD